MSASFLHPLRNERGMTLMVVLVAVVAVGLAAGITGSIWSTITQRERETELLWRGNQYREAFKSYFETKHGGAKGQYPTSLEQLVKDPRSLAPLRHIRRIYKDPMTGEDFALIKQGQHIVGVYSSSDLEPFKKDGFSEENESFAGASHYNEWQFMYAPKAARNQPKGAGTPAAKSP
jgi:type II secretory pathway pseudopilin PulG